MFRALLLKEFRQHLMSFRFVISAVLFLTVSVTGLFVVGGRFRRDLVAYETEQSKWREQLQSASSLRDLGLLGVAIARRPLPPTVIGRGLEEKMPRSVQVAVYADPTGTANRYVNPIFFLFQAPDLLNMVTTVGTLLALFFVFDTVCGEKEEGTLRLIMSHPVSRHVVLLGKCAGAYLALLVPFVVSLLVAGVALQLQPELRPDLAEWLRIAAFGGAVALLLAVFFAIGLFVSTLNRRASTALVMSVLVWVVLVLALPNLAPVMTRPFVRIPSAAEVAEEKRIVRDEMRHERWEKIRRTTDPKERERIEREYEEREQAAIGEIESRRQRRVEAHVRLARAASRLSPTACFTYAATHILGTGVEDYFDYVESVRRYAVDLRLYYRQKSEEMRRRPPSGDGMGRWTAEFDVRDLPQYDFAPAPLRVGIDRALLDLLLMGMMFVVLFLAAYMTFLRYDVR